MIPKKTYMLMAATHDRRRDGGRYRDDGSLGNYDDAYDRYDRNDTPQSRFRDRRGREHYDNGRFAPMNDGGYGPYSRYGGDGWPRMDHEMMDHYPMTPYVPPVYRENGGMRYRGDRVMNKIGFSMDGEIGKPWEMGGDYRMDAGYSAGDEMAYRKGGDRMSGYGAGEGHHPLTRDIAEAWVAKMENSDGSTGAHWTMEQTKQIQSQKGIGLDPIKFWVTMNMMYSDYFMAAEKAGVGSVDFYADMAKAFLTDKDAQPDKLDRYYCAVVKH